MDADLHNIQHIESFLGATRDNVVSPPDFTVRSDSALSASCYSAASSYQLHLTPQRTENEFSVFEEITTDSTEDDGLTIIEDAPVTPMALLQYNRMYQKRLTDFSKKIEIQIAISEDKHRKLQERLHELECSKEAQKSQERTTKITLAYFGIPYFKDKYFNVPPKNDDAILGESIGFRNAALVSPNKPVTKCFISKLVNAVMDQSREFRARSLARRKDELTLQLKYGACMSPEDVKLISSEIDAISHQTLRLDLIPEAELLNIHYTAIDWNRISFDYFQRSRSAEQLKLHWIHYLQPGVNTGPWSKEEKQNLKILVRNGKNSIDWDEIALKLQSNRTAFDCFSRYQERHNEEHRKFGWTDEENKKFIDSLSLMGDLSMDEIHWSKLRLLFPGRSKTQLYSHFRYHSIKVDTSNKPFKKSEDVVILEATKIGLSFEDIAHLLSKRSVAQIRKRYDLLRTLPENQEEQNWTVKEDNFLLKLEDQSLLTHHLARKHFPKRRYDQVYSHFHFLRMQQTSPREYIEELRAKAMAKAPKNKMAKDKSVFAKKISNLIAQFCQNAAIDPVKGVSLSKLNKVDKRFTESISRAVRYNKTLRSKTSGRPKKSLVVKEKALKEILRPLWTTNTKRPRKLSFDGDGREHGLVLGAFYRLLRCNFTKWPSENSTDEELKEAGIAEQHQLPFRNLIGLVKENTTTGLDKRKVIIAPNLNSLTGFRGLLLHRKYLRSSAHSGETTRIPAVPNSNSAVSSNLAAVEYVPGPSQGNYEYEFESSPAMRNFNVNRQPMAPIPENSYCTGMPGMSGIPVIPVNPSISQVPMQPFHTMPPAMPAMSVMNYIDNSHCGMGQIPQCVPNIGFIPQQVTSAQNCGMPPNAANYHQANQMFVAPPIRAADMNESIESANARYYQRNTPHQSTAMVAESQQMVSAESDLPSFGNAKADAILLSRLISVFFWPGIMSSVGVPKEMMDSANERARGILEQQKLAREKQQEALKSAPKLTTKQKRAAHIKSVVQKRYPKNNTANAGDVSVSSSADDVQQQPGCSSGSLVPPPNPKKLKMTSQQSSTPKPKVLPPPSDRVTRTRSRTN